ncbi:hypothetical protein QIA36_07060 (plasmid) [Borreliella yangtzensis]|uniref:hypothetical protein n=1 Tax=Borreliella yangtzensis TaxID=683292 RepID=UPI003B9F5476
MKIRMKHLVRSLYIRRDRIWNVYMSSEVQNKSKDSSIKNFPRLGPENFDYDYLYQYICDWIKTKYDGKANWFKFEKVDDREYICIAKRYSSLKKLLNKIIKDYKDMFIKKLQDGSDVRSRAARSLPESGLGSVPGPVPGSLPESGSGPEQRKNPAAKG